MPRKDNSPVSIRIRLRYPDVESFVEKYAANVSQGGMFIQSRAPQPVGRLLRFEVLLADGERLLKGEGRVIWVREYDAAHPTKVHGMGVKFTDLDDASKAVVEQVLDYKAETGGTPPPTRRPSPTMEVRALVKEAKTASEAEEEEIAEAETSLATPHEPAGEPEPEPELAPESQLDSPGEPEPDLPPRSVVPPQRPAVEDSRRDPDAVLTAQILGSVPMVSQAFEAGGDGVEIALATAEQLIVDLMREAAISDHVVDQALARVAAEPGPPTAGMEELEQLLVISPPPQVSFDEAIAAMHQSLGAAVVTPVAPASKWAPPPPAAPLPPSRETHEPDAPQEPGDPLLEQPEASEPEAAAEELEAPAVEAAPEEPLDDEAPAPVPQVLMPPPGDTAPVLTDEELGFDAPAEPQFDPSLLEAAASVSRNKGAAAQTFDLSEEPQSSPGDVFETAQAATAAEIVEAPPSDGWKNLHTVTELLDHDSSDVLQDMASQTKYQDAQPEERASEEPAPVSEGMEEPAPVSEGAGAVQVAADQIMEEEDAEEEDVYAGMDSSDLALDVLHEVIDEVTRDASRGHPAHDPDTLQEPDTAPEADARDYVENPTASALDNHFNVNPEASLDYDDLNDRLMDDDDFEDFETEGNTEVTAVPNFDETNGGNLPGDDIFPGDPDLDNEIFEALADAPAPVQEPVEPADPPSDVAPIEEPDNSEEYIPSLDDLASHVPVAQAQESPEPRLPDDGSGLRVIADDPEPAEPSEDESIQPRKSGIFRRIFGKKK